jgi:hypothetical protein
MHHFRFHLSVLTFAIIAALLLAVFPGGVVMAQDEAPPPEETPTSEEPASAEVAAVEEALPETVEVLPLDSTGEPLSLAEEQAAVALATGDPIYCSGTLTPDVGICSPTLASIADAVAFAVGTGDTAGTIYVAADYNDLAPTTIDGAVFTNPFTLFLIGGVGNMTTGEVSGRTLLDNPLTISNLAALFLANFGVDVTGADAITLTNDGDVMIENVDAHSDYRGMVLTDNDSVMITDSDSSSNGNAGLTIYNSGAVLIDGLGLENNGATSEISANSVSLFGVRANGVLDGGGMIVNADGDVFVEASSFSGNAGTGLTINTLESWNAVLCSKFNDNMGDGLVITGSNLLLLCNKFTGNAGMGVNATATTEIDMGSNVISSNGLDSVLTAPTVLDQYAPCSLLCPSCGGGEGEEEKEPGDKVQIVVVEVTEPSASVVLKSGYATVFKLKEKKEDGSLREVQRTILMEGAAPEGSTAVYTPLDESELPAPFGEGVTFMPYGFNLAITDPEGNLVTEVTGMMVLRFFLPEGFKLPLGMRLVIQYYDPETSSWTPVSTGVGGGMAYAYVKKTGTYALTMMPNP